MTTERYSSSSLVSNAYTNEQNMAQCTYFKNISQVIAFFFCSSVLCGAWSKSQAGRIMVLEATMSTLFVRDIGVPRSLTMPLKSTSSKASFSQFGISKRRDRGRVDRTKDTCEMGRNFTKCTWSYWIEVASTCISVAK